MRKKLAVTTRIGNVPASRDGREYRTMLAACRGVAECTVRIGSVWATETEPEMGPVLKAFRYSGSPRGR